MSFAGFLIGIVMMVIGFFAVWKTNIFVNSFGDIGKVLGFNSSPLFSWKIAGMILLSLGFLVAFGLFGVIFNETIGRIISF